MLKICFGLLVLLAGLLTPLTDNNNQIFLFSLHQLQEEGHILLTEATMRLSPAQGAPGHHTRVPRAEVLAGKQDEDCEDHRGRGRQRSRGQAQQHQDGALHGCVNTTRRSTLYKECLSSESKCRESSDRAKREQR